MKKIFLIFILGYMSVLNFVSSEDAALEDVSFRHVYGENRTVYLQLRLNESASLLNSGKLRLLEQTILYVFGWNEKIDEAPTTIDITDAFLDRQENFIVLNYEKIAGQAYSTAVSKVVPVSIGRELIFRLGLASRVEMKAVNVLGIRTIPSRYLTMAKYADYMKNVHIGISEYLAKKVALALSNLFKSGLKVAKFHCIGFSLGAHICGAIARELKALNPTYIVPRISGLDPAGPSYSKTSKNVGLSKNDATFVDSIHTDAGGFGQSFSSGDVDFYTNNNGKGPQLGCPTGLAAILEILLLGHCDHDKAVHYYADSARGVKYVATLKNSITTAVLGYNAPKTATGDYYVTIK